MENYGVQDYLMAKIKVPNLWWKFNTPWTRESEKHLHMCTQNLNIMWNKP